MDQASATGEASAGKFSRVECWMPTKRWALIGLAIGGAIAGLALGWDWIVAAGMAPLVVSVLPCVAMCAAMRSPVTAGTRRSPKQQTGRQTRPWFRESREPSNEVVEVLAVFGRHVPGATARASGPR